MCFWHTVPLYLYLFQITTVPLYLWCQITSVCLFYSFLFFIISPITIRLNHFRKTISAGEKDPFKPGALLLTYVEKSAVYETGLDARACTTLLFALQRNTNVLRIYSWIESQCTVGYFVTFLSLQFFTVVFCFLPVVFMYCHAFKIEQWTPGNVLLGGIHSRVHIMTWKPFEIFRGLHENVFENWINWFILCF